MINETLMSKCKYNINEKLLLQTLPYYYSTSCHFILALVAWQCINPLLIW